MTITTLRTWRVRVGLEPKENHELYTPLVVAADDAQGAATLASDIFRRDYVDHQAARCFIHSVEYVGLVRVNVKVETGEEAQSPQSSEVSDLPHAEGCGVQARGCVLGCLKDHAEARADQNRLEWLAQNPAGLHMTKRRLETIDGESLREAIDWLIQ